jgi:hypothetical protein
MKKFVNIIVKSTQIKKRLSNIMKGHKHKNKEKHDHEEHELDDHNDPSNWSYC